MSFNAAMYGGHWTVLAADTRHSDATGERLADAGGKFHALPFGWASTSAQGDVNVVHRAALEALSMYDPADGPIRLSGRFVQAAEDAAQDIHRDPEKAGPRPWGHLLLATRDGLFALDTERVGVVRCPPGQPVVGVLGDELEALTDAAIEALSRAREPLETVRTIAGQAARFAEETPLVGPFVHIGLVERDGGLLSWFGRSSELAEATDAELEAAALANGGGCAVRAAYIQRNAGPGAVQYGYSGTLLTSQDTGSAANIGIKSHSVAYADGTVVNYGSHTIGGLSYDTDYWVYADDPTLSGGSSNYHAVAAANIDDIGSATGRYFVGRITTAASGGGSTGGGGGGGGGISVV